MLLKANNGRYLTQVQDVPVEERIFKTHIALGTTAEAAQWKEVTEAEKAAIINEATVLGVDNLDAAYLTQVETLIGQIPQVINTKNLTANEALAHKEWYPYWGEEGAEMGKEVPAGFRLRHRAEGEEEDTLYEVVQKHTLQADWVPGVETASLYKVVSATHAGTKEDPIPYQQMMAIEQGKYYTEDGILYVGILTTQTGYPNKLSELFTLVEKVEEE